MQNVKTPCAVSGPMEPHGPYTWGQGQERDGTGWLAGRWHSAKSRRKYPSQGPSPGPPSPGFPLVIPGTWGFEATAWATSQSPKLRKGRNGPLLTPSPVGLGSYRSWMAGPQGSLINSQVLSPRCPGSVSPVRRDGLWLQMNSIQLITDQFLGPVTALRAQPPPGTCS